MHRSRLRHWHSLRWHVCWPHRRRGQCCWGIGGAGKPWRRRQLQAKGAHQGCAEALCHCMSAILLPLMTWQPFCWLSLAEAGLPDKASRP